MLPSSPPRNACRPQAEPQRPGAAANHSKGRACDAASEAAPTPWPGEERVTAALNRFVASKCESIDTIIRADEKAFRCGNQGLEMSKTSERCAWRCDEQLSRVAAKTVEAIVAFRAEGPDNRIGAAIRRCRDR